MMYPNSRQVPWRESRWPNFSPLEFACPHCGEFWFDERYFDAVQAVRRRLGRPVRINSAHRCIIYNRIVGGALRSEHKKIALDLSTRGHDRMDLLQACMESGFGSFGFYGTFLHTDMRRGRVWITEKGKQAWEFLTYSASGRPQLPAVSSGSLAA